MSEYRLHVAIVDHIRSAFPLVSVIHIPNQSKDATSAFFEKKMGTMAGASDLLLIWHKAQSAFMEIKVEKGRISSVQNKFLSAMDAKGHRTAIVRSVLEAHNKLKWWGLQPLYDNVKEPDMATQQEKFRRGEAFFAPSAED